MMQFVANSFGEFGICDQYLDSELYFVDDALPVGLVSRPQFEVRNSVVQAIAVFVMHAFEFGQWATNMFRHYVAMFQYFAAPAKIEDSISGRMYMSFFRNGAPTTSFVSAFFATKFLSFVVTGMLAVQRLHKASFFRNAAQLALKSWSGFFVHEGQLPDSFAAVKGVV